MIEVLKQALEALENNRQTHHYCEDTWYSCPKHEDGCSNDFEGDECNCGADKANLQIDAAITSLRQAIAELESQEPFAWINQGAIDWIASDKQSSNAYVQTNLAKRKNDSATVPVFTHPPQRTEQNFCSRCGKRTNYIHTCTPPRG